VKIRFIAVLAGIYQAGLLTPIPILVYCELFPLVTQYKDVEQLLNGRTVGQTNNKQSNTVKQSPRGIADIQDFQ